MQGIPVVMYRHINEQAIRTRMPDQRGVHVCVVGNEVKCTTNVYLGSRTIYRLFVTDPACLVSHPNSF